MRRLLVILSLTLMCASASAQGIFHYYTGLFLPDRDAPVRMDRLGIDFVYNSWLEVPEGVKVKPYSIGVNVFRIYDIPFGHSNFGIGIGYGLSSHNVHHNGAFMRVPDTVGYGTYTQLVPHDESYDYRKNKISSNYFEVPFEIRFRTKKWQNKQGDYKGPFRIYPGFKAGYLVNVHTSIKDDNGKFKHYNFPNTNKFRYGATLRIGIGKLCFYGFYSLTDFFREGKGDKLQPFSLGVSFLTF